MVVQPVRTLYPESQRDNRESKYGEYVHSQTNQVYKEVSVVPGTYAVVHPRTVVVKCLQQTSDKQNIACIALQE